MSEEWETSNERIVKWNEKQSAHLRERLEKAKTMGAKHLTLNCKPGDYVYWCTMARQTFYGTLKEWDNGTAIVLMLDGKERAVRRE